MLSIASEIGRESGHIAQSGVSNRASAPYITLMDGYQSRASDRFGAAFGAVVVSAALGYALVSGLGVRIPVRVAEALTLIALPPEPAPPRVEKTVPRPKKSEKKEGAAAPPNIRSKATQVVAPPPVISLPPPPIVAAPVAGVGNQASSGASDRVGPGTGAGGIGHGTGSGRYGDGDGDGGDETPPRWLRGRLKDSDYPAAAKDAMIGGRVGVRYTVEVNGRVTHCTVTESSGSALLDGTTCRLIEERFRFAPSRDEDGRPVRAIIVENHSWIMRDEPEADRGGL